MKNNSIIQQIKNGKIANLVMQVLDRCLTCCTNRKGTCTHITPGYMHVECSVHSPATLQPAQRRHPIYCHNSSNRFGIQAVDDSQNELPSSLKSLRNLILQNRLLLKTLHFLPLKLFLFMGVMYSTSVQNNLCKDHRIICWISKPVAKQIYTTNLHLIREGYKQ